MKEQLPRYAVWNNKGGVGKTFVSFVMSSAYAAAHPDRTVVVIDMCPQANVSEILLGGSGPGSIQLNKLLSESPRKTIGGYFDERISSPHAPTGKEPEFLVHLRPLNKNLPNNMYLIAGDPSLELQAQAINQIASQVLPADVWGKVHSWVADIIAKVSENYPNSVFFIDCNPSFAAYTELALLASTRLIVPCTADGSSARAIDNVGQLLFGIGVPESYSTVNFSTRAKNAGMALPSIHLVPLNRSTQFDKKASKAFGAMYDEIRKRINHLKTTLPSAFSTPVGTSSFFDIPDAHSVSVVASHLGLPLNDLKVNRYSIHGVRAQVNQEPLLRYQKAINDFVSLL
jgi:cellulose biosynthesis protein BcsQ